LSEELTPEQPRMPIEIAIGVQGGVQPRETLLLDAFYDFFKAPLRLTLPLYAFDELLDVVSYLEVLCTGQKFITDCSPSRWT